MRETIVHETKVIVVRDPYLSQRFAIECSWCGVFGREEYEADAQGIAARHAEATGFERFK